MPTSKKFEHDCFLFTALFLGFGAARKDPGQSIAAFEKREGCKILRPALHSIRAPPNREDKPSVFKEIPNGGGYEEVLQKYASKRKR